MNLKLVNMVPIFEYTSASLLMLSSLGRKFLMKFCAVVLRALEAFLSSVLAALASAWTWVNSWYSSFMSDSPLSVKVLSMVTPAGNWTQVPSRLRSST